MTISAMIINGDVVLPSGIFGAQCRRNAYGYSYADKSKPKERRYVSTNWVHPFGNTNASEVAVDIYRPCWPQVEVPPYGIELQLFKSKDGQLYVIVVPDCRQNAFGQHSRSVFLVFGSKSVYLINNKHFWAPLFPFLAIIFASFFRFMQANVSPTFISIRAFPIICV